MGKELRKAVTGMMNRNYQDIMNMVTASGMATMQQRQQRNFDRMDRQVDAQLKTCLPGYEPAEPDDDMNITYINAGIQLDDNSMSKLVEGVSQPDEPGGNSSQMPPGESSTGPSVGGQPDRSVEADRPKEPPADEATPIRRIRKRRRKKQKSLWQKIQPYVWDLLKLAAVLGALYWVTTQIPEDTDTDTTNELRLWDGDE